jgi:hypothetical protein
VAEARGQFVNVEEVGSPLLEASTRRLVAGLEELIACYGEPQSV